MESTSLGLDSGDDVRLVVYQIRVSRVGRFEFKVACGGAFGRLRFRLPRKSTRSDVNGGGMQTFLGISTGFRRDGWSRGRHNPTRS